MSNSDGSRGLVTMYNECSWALVQAHAQDLGGSGSKYGYGLVHSLCGECNQWWQYQFAGECQSEN